MRDRASYNGIGCSMVVRFNLNELSGQDQVQLCRDLMDMLGITEQLILHPDETAKAQELITKCWEVAWKKPAQQA